MTTLIVEIPEKTVKMLIDLIEQIGGEVISIDEGKKQAKVLRKKQILSDLEDSIRFVKQHREGKVQAKSIDQLLNEL